MIDSRRRDLALLAGDMLSTKISRITPLTGGRNNRVYRVDSPRGRFVLKIYFRHPGDRRDRRTNEYRFATFLWEKGYRGLARPVATSKKFSATLFSFLQGKTPGKGEIRGRGLKALGDFLLFCRWCSRKLSPRSFPDASEACFSLHSFERRIHMRARKVLQSGPPVARSLVQTQVLPVLKDWKKVAFVLVGKRGVARNLAPARRTLSPADHGFQNAICFGRKLTFIDFEYAGWDDPATVLANACLHPGVPLSPESQAILARYVMKEWKASKEDWARFRLVYPLQALKWSLILLNPLLPVGNARRRFAGENTSRSFRHKVVDFARAYVKSAEDSLDSGHWLNTLAKNSGQTS
jgi:hypothetical protein